MTAITAITAAERTAVYERDGGRCAACGTTNALTIQHRINRQMGSSLYRDGFAFWLTLCAGCNGALESDPHFAQSGRDKGWKLVTTEDPEAVAVFVVWAREWRLLDTAGRYVVVFDRGPHEFDDQGVAA